MWTKFLKLFFEDYNNQTNFMPAETIKLENGAYKMYGELNVIDDLFTGQDIDYDNIARNLVKSIMEQSKYFMWGWGVKFSNTGIGIMAYLREMQDILVLIIVLLQKIIWILKLSVQTLA